MFSSPPQRACKIPGSQLCWNFLKAQFNIRRGSDRHAANVSDFPLVSPRRAVASSVGGLLKHKVVSQDGSYGWLVLRHFSCQGKASSNHDFNFSQALRWCSRFVWNIKKEKLRINDSVSSLVLCTKEFYSYIVSVLFPICYLI